MLLRKLLLLMSIGVLGVGLAPGTRTVGADDDDDDDWEDRWGDWDDGPRFRAWRGDCVAVAKRALTAGETLDGEGGFTVYGKLIPASRSLAEGALPIGLAHGVKLKKNVAAGAIVRASDVALDEMSLAVRIRKEMEASAADLGGPAAH